jgi:hypothetical protein
MKSKKTNGATNTMTTTDPPSPLLQQEVLERTNLFTFLISLNNMLNSLETCGIAQNYTIINRVILCLSNITSKSVPSPHLKYLPYNND